MLLELAFLPYESIKNIDAIFRSIYRMKHKVKLLEWVTAEDGEKLYKNDINTHFREMFVNIILGAVLLFSNNFLLILIGILWLIAPIFAWFISVERSYKNKITEADKKFIIEVANRTWKFFEDYITPENNYLMIDNYQEDREAKVVKRTSSTNIGLSLVAVISAYDLGFIDLNKTYAYIENILNTINRLAKWNGHLYNWYNTKTLEPLKPRYISTVDSGNFIGYMYIVKEFLEENKEKINCEHLIQNIVEIIKQANFYPLYSEDTKLFSIGYNLEENKLTDSYYDFLASEARQASLVAISKGDVPSKHWSYLSRTLTSLNGYKGLISWTGTAFEYLMPNLNLASYKGSLLDEASKFAVLCQIEYAKKLNIPWGISESAYSIKDMYNNYQYKAFGIPWLGLKRGLENEVVVSPYSTFLSISENENAALKNIQQLRKIGAFDKYGFYEAIDFTKNRIRNKKFELVKTYMAHHQALILLSINNLLNDGILKIRFNRNPEIEATNILLQERMPINAILTKENKEKVKNPKYVVKNNYVERVIENHNQDFRNIGVLSNENYKIVINDIGNGYSEYDGYLINQYKETLELKNGINFYIKNLRTEEIINPYLDAKVIFAPDKISFIKKSGKLRIITEITISPGLPIEIRNIKIENIGNLEEVYEIIAEIEPVLSEKFQEYSHPTFNKLFLKVEYENNLFLITRKDREGREEINLGVNLYTDSEPIVDLEYEIDKEKYYGRNQIDIPRMIKENKSFSSSIKEVTDTILALKKTINIKSDESQNISLVMIANKSKEFIFEKMKKLQATSEILKIFEIARNRAEEELQFLQIKAKDLQYYQYMLDYIFQYSPNYKMSPGENRSINHLWKYGISGDLPIIAVKISKIESIGNLKALLKAYEYFKSKSILIDLVIVDEEDNVYEKYVYEYINELIYEMQLNGFVNTKNGIFIINENLESQIEINTIFLLSKMSINVDKFDLYSYIEKLASKKCKEKINEINYDNTDEIIPKTKEDLRFYNSYGGFSSDGKEYHLAVNYENTTPIAWSHILANKFFGTLVTDNFAGYTWCKNSRLNRLTSWTNEPITNIPSEIWYVVENEKVWTINSGVIPNKNYYYSTFGFGYAKFKNVNNDLIQEVEVFIPENEKIKVNNISIKNTANMKRKLKFLIYIKTVLGEEEVKLNQKLEVYKENNILYVRNVLANDDFFNEIFVTSDLEVKSFTGNKDAFLGKDGILKPRLIFNSLDNKNGLGKNSCLAFELEVNLKEYEKKEFTILLGQDEKQKSKELVNKYIVIQNREIELENVKRNWKNLVSSIEVKTPSEALNILLNGWLVYQTLSSRMYGKTGYFQSGGAYGFRDQLQDGLGMKYIDVKILEEQIINCAAHQFIEGDVLHWWHNETKRGIRTKFSDDMLWLVYGVLEYLNFTNDYSILDNNVEYLSGKILADDEMEHYDIFYKSEISENIYSHCNRAIEKVISRGLNPFPKIGSGDWNDGFSNVGIKGIGQSVWMGFFLYDILNRWYVICEYKNDTERANRYQKIKENLKKSLNTDGWDGRWFKRAITDEGKEIGSMNSLEARIDNISQSWSVISNAGDNDKKFIAMESAKNYLVDYENGLIKLFDPPFEKSDINPGYIKGYKPGIRENGGQYTHGAIWFVMAEAILGFGDDAVRLLEMINPINHSYNKELIQKYKIEPYVIAADVYSNVDLKGRGGWSWYTGSSSWFYKVAIEYILGLKISNGYLYVEPTIDKNWKEYEIKYKYKTSIYNIKVINKNNKNTGVKSFIFNGVTINEKKIKLEDNGKINVIEILM